MRCIEITIFGLNFGTCIWLTLTWDVLKCGNNWIKKKAHARLTLTWDVLKW